MTETLAYRYTWDLDDLANILVARRRLAYRSRWSRSAFSLGLAVVAIGTVVGVAYLVADHDKGWREKLVSTMPLVLVWATIYLAYPRNLLTRLQLRTHARSLPDGSRDVEWGYHDDGLWSRTTLAESNYSWAMFTRIVEAPECFLFYQGKLLALWLPGKGFPTSDAVQAFVRAARTHVAEFVSLGDCRCPATPGFPGWDQG